jgi:hypothetical protein
MELIVSDTLGSLCDKLTIVKLKIWHSEDPLRLNSLALQEKELITEIDEYISLALEGRIPLNKLSFSANKVYKEDGNLTRVFNGGIALVFSELATINCELWHEQEKVYDFQNVPTDQKNSVIKRLAVLNLERNSCIDRINASLISLIK